MVRAYRHFHRATVLFVAALLVLGALRTADHRRAYYLALGDSLSAGVQPGDGPLGGPWGYPRQVRAALELRGVALELIELGCSGESARMMISGRGSCRYGERSQLDEAVAFLRAHRNEVALVTVNVGSNDLLECALSERAETCFPAALAALDKDLDVILTAIRDAAGPQTTIVGLNYYDAFAAQALAGPEGEARARATFERLVHPMNEVFRRKFDVEGEVVLADVERAFGAADFTTRAQAHRLGSVLVRVARICDWTWACSKEADMHPTSVGYGVIAETVVRTLEDRRDAHGDGAARHTDVRLQCLERECE